MQESPDDLQIAIQLGNSAVVISCFVPKFNHQVPIGIQRLKHLLTFTSSFLHSSRTKNIKWWVSPVPAHHFFRVFLNVRHNSHGSDPAESSCTTSEQSSAFPNYGKRSQPRRMNHGCSFATALRASESVRRPFSASQSTSSILSISTSWMAGASLTAWGTSFEYVRFTNEFTKCCTKFSHCDRFVHTACFFFANNGK